MRNGSHYGRMARVRTIVVAAVAVAVAAHAAQAQVPRGRRAKRGQPTHVVVAQAECAGNAGTFVLRPGLAVVVRKRKRRSAGLAAVQVTGAVSATCTVEVSALGKRLAQDVTLPRGGDVYAGALVRVLPDKASRGAMWVESTGAVATRFEVPRGALTAEPVQFLYREPPTRRWVAPFAATRLYERKTSVGTNTPEVGTIAAESDTVLLEQAGELARVRSHGPVELEGWVLNRQLADRRANSEVVELLKPTHEVFIGAQLYATVDGNEPVAELRGGALVEVNKLHGGRVKITTTGDAIATGFVDVATLRPLSSPGG